MLNKVKALVGKLSSKMLLRISLVIATVVSIALGNAMLNNYEVVDGNKVYFLVSSNNNMNNVVKQAGVVLDESDMLSSTYGGNSTIITVDRNNDDYNGNTNVSTTFDFGRFELLNQNTAQLPINDGTCNVPQFVVSYVEETVKESVSYTTKKVYTSDLLKGETKVTAGKKGEKEIVYSVKMINGIVVSKEKQSETVTIKPVNRIERIGTRVAYNSANAVQTSDDVKCISEIKPAKPIELDKNGIPVSYANVLTGKASAYWQGTGTATGVKAKPGYVAVNPKQIPYGTKMYIVSSDGKYVYGYAIAADTGGFVNYTGSNKRIVDLRFNSASAGYAFGVREVKIYILD